MRVTIKELELPLLPTSSQKSSLPVGTMPGTAATLILALSGIFLSINLFIVVLLLSLLLTEVTLPNFLCDEVGAWVRASCPRGL